MSSKSRAKPRPTRTVAEPPSLPPEATSQAAPNGNVPASEGGVNLERFVARYEAEVGKLTTAKLMLEDQLDGTKEELHQVKEALDDLIARLPKSEPTDAPRNGATPRAKPAKKTAAAPKPKEGD